MELKELLNRKAHILLLIIFLLFAFAVVINAGTKQTDKHVKSLLSADENKKIDRILASLTLEEKVYMLHGTGLFTSGGNKRFNIDELHYTDGPFGIREEVGRDSWEPLKWTNDSATFFPTGSALAATWNPEMALKYGSAIGQEARSRQKQILLGPAINICRTPINGRTFEYLSEDPFLNSRLAVNYIKGVQAEGVIACVKHYAVNNQEWQRSVISSELDERTLREIYLPAFQAAIEEGKALAVMTAYNKFRGVYCSESDYLINLLLKAEWGFKGIALSDWGGTHSTVAAALGGLDIEMCGDTYFGEKLVEVVRQGEVSEKVINEKVRRILTVMFIAQRKALKKPEANVSTPAHNQVAYDIASQSITLLKNYQNTLPLNAKMLHSIAVIGDNAKCTQATGGYGAGVKARYEITPLAGLQKLLGNAVTIKYAKGYSPVFSKDTTIAWGKRPVNRPDLVLMREAVKAARKSDVAIIFAGTNHDVETESTDRMDLKLPFGQDELIKEVVKANPRTIVVVIAGGPTDLQTAMETAPAVLYGWYNGSQAGRALADVLFGKINPSGKLPFTFPVNLEDSPAHALKTYPGDSLKSHYDEGILVGYRWYDTKKIQPQLCFGYGLSYTTFAYSGIATNGPIFSEDGKALVTLKLKNTGKRDGYETVQLYSSFPDSKVFRAEKELKGIAKVFVRAGKEKKIVIPVKIRDLAYYDDASKCWTVEIGKYRLFIGASSRDIQKQIDIVVE